MRVTMLATETTTTPDVGAELKVVSQAGGRMRVRAGGYDIDAVRAVAIEDTVARVPGVRAVYAYPRTGSLVICGDGDRKVDPQADRHFALDNAIARRDSWWPRIAGPSGP
jgi:hypothetical protein